jgi:rSAM/selenodomain-associated transferase 1
MHGEELILVFAKPAVPGRTKTRLVPLLSPEQAARFHLAALTDTLSRAREAGRGRVELFVAGDDEVAGEFARRFPGTTVRTQRGSELGARLAGAFSDSFARGARRVLIVGSDHPTLPPEHLARGLAALERTGIDIVFGPSRDGGYYAVGVRRESWPRAGAAFEDVPWSTPGVLTASLERARGAGLAVALLPDWYDVDRPGDLERVLRDARPDSASARFLEQVRELHGRHRPRDRRGS